MHNCNLKYGPDQRLGKFDKSSIAQHIKATVHPIIDTCIILSDKILQFD